MAPIIQITDAPPEGAFQRLWGPLLEFNAQQVGAAASRVLAALLLDQTTQQITGGLWGRTLWGSLYIDMIFVPVALRRNGLGTELMKRAEAEAVERACHCSWLDTYAFQARPFYEKLGYSVFGTIDGPPPIYPRHFLKKHLNAHPP